MSRMLQALKNLSSRGTEVSTPREPAGTPASDASALDAPPPDPDPVLPPVDRGQRMKELLVKHLSAPTATEVFRKLTAGGEELSEERHVLSGNSNADELDGFQSASSGSMTVSMNSVLSQFPPPAARQTSAPSPVEMEPSPVARAYVTPGLDAIDGVADLLATIEDDAESHGEEISLSFASEAERIQVLGLGRQESEVGSQESGDRRQETGDRGQESEVGGPSSEVRGQGSDVVADSPTPVYSLTPSPSLPLTPSPPRPLSHSPTPIAGGSAAALEHETPIPSPPAAASPLDHLADARPLVTYQPEDEPTPEAPEAPDLPIRKISRAKTRLEQRILDNLAHPSRSLPYRELADRLAQDLRLLTGRCLLFTGVGPASHADDVLSHVAALMAEDDAEVLLVDADFTRAAISVGFGALKETGLGEMPDGNNRIQDLVLPTLLPNVSLIPAGRKSLPDTLGVVDQMAQLLTKLEERYALVLIDGGAHTGPLLPALARLCDATYFVVRLGATDARAASTALKAFRATGARVMGCVATSAAA